MDPVCDSCGTQRAVVYCKADAARLCLSCDQHVHAANALSRRHLRSLLCDHCLSQPAARRCLHLGLSLCLQCHLSDVPEGGAAAAAAWVPMNWYSGCPSMPEITWILSSAGSGPTMSTINENLESTCWDTALPPDFDPTWMPETATAAGVGDQQQQQKQKNLPFSATLPYPQFKDIDGLFEDNGNCEGSDTGDVGLNMNNFDGLFDCTQPKCPFLDGVLDGYFMDKNFSVGDSNGYNNNAIEASSSAQHDSMTLSSTLHAISSNPDQMLLNLNRNINSGFTSGNINQNMSLSLSSLTGESSVADYEDCGVSPMFLNGESPWDPNLETRCPQARNEAKMRYNEKKKSRLFGKQIRYASRKARADTRKRVKGIIILSWRCIIPYRNKLQETFLTFAREQ